jgi:hypothetical protein
VNLSKELDAQIFGADKRKSSRQFAAVLPQAIADYIERESARMMISGAAVIRQLIAKGIQSDLESNPPPWIEEEQEKFFPDPPRPRSALSHHSKEAA